LALFRFAYAALFLIEYRIENPPITYTTRIIIKEEILISYERFESNGINGRTFSITASNTKEAIMAPVMRNVLLLVVPDIKFL
jgi:hypothetical protein